MARTTKNRDAVKRLLAGDPRVLADVRRAIEAAVRRFYRPTDGRQRELVQEAMGRVFLGVAGRRYRGDASLQTYAGAVAKNTCREQSRRRKQWAQLEPDALPSDDRWSAPEEALLRDEEYHRNLQALADLPPDCLQLFRMVFVEQLPYREVARRLRISEGALRVRLHRCRAKCAESSLSRRDSIPSKQTTRTTTKKPGV